MRISRTRAPTCAMIGYGSTAFMGAEMTPREALNRISTDDKLWFLKVLLALYDASNTPLDIHDLQMVREVRKRYGLAKAA
jgi:hypothetical protein